MKYDYEVYSWADVLVALQAQEAVTIIRLPKHNLQHPAEAGARRSIGLPVGQSAKTFFRSLWNSSSLQRTFLMVIASKASVNTSLLFSEPYLVLPLT